MDTGKVISRQLAYCLRGAETEEQRAQVEWWLAKVAELRKQQPPAESVAEQLTFHAEPASRATGTHGGAR